MIEPPATRDEPARQRALERYRILDTDEDPLYDDLSTLASQITGAPIALITMLDRERNWFKSRRGVELREAPRQTSFCGHAIAAEETITIVEDARADPRFADNPLVTELGIVFYAGAPVFSSDGYAIGTLCVFDGEPRTLADTARAALIGLARQVETLLELRLRNAELDEARRRLERRNEDLRRFAGVVAHDLKSPIAGVALLADAVAAEANDLLSADARRCLEQLECATASIARYVDELFSRHVSETSAAERVELAPLMKELRALTVAGRAEAELLWPEGLPAIETSRTALLQTLVNLVTNALKYNDKPRPRIEIGFAERAGRHEFRVSDNGLGIAPERFDEVFEPRSTGGVLDRDGKVGTGTGLDTIRRLLGPLGGEIAIGSSRPGEGTTFVFSLPAEGEEPLARAA